MSRIKVTNTAIIVDNYHMGECEDLEKQFKVWDPIKHKLEIYGIYYDEEKSRLYLPGGIDLWFVQRCLQEKYFDHIDHTKYKKIDDIKLKVRPRDSIQIESLQFLTSNGEYENLLYEPSRCLNLSTGVGKTYCSIATIAYFKIKSAIITSSSTLLHQWHDRILDYTNLQEKDILNISGSDTINMILMGNSKKAQEASIFLITHGTIRSWCDQYSWSRLSEVFEALGIGMKFIDEYHQDFINSLLIQYHTNVKYTYLITATPGRSDFKEDRIFQLAIKNIPSIDLFDENNDPHVDYLAIKYNSRPTPLQISQCKSRTYGLDLNKYSEYLIGQPAFYEMLRVLFEDFIKRQKGKTLIYLHTNNGILAVYQWIQYHYPDYASDIGIFTSLVDKEQKIKEREHKIILSTMKSASAGEDIKHLSLVVVLAEPFKSPILARQSLGRIRDYGCLYIELVDVAFQLVRNFYFKKLPVFNKYALSVSDAALSTYELDQRCHDAIQKNRSTKQVPIHFKDPRFINQYPVIKDNNKGPIKPIHFLDDPIDVHNIWEK